MRGGLWWNVDTTKRNLTEVCILDLLYISILSLNKAATLEFLFTESPG